MLSCKRQPLLSCKRQPLLSCKRQPFFVLSPAQPLCHPESPGKSKKQGLKTDSLLPAKAKIRTLHRFSFAGKNKKTKILQTFPLAGRRLQDIPRNNLTRGQKHFLFVNKNCPLLKPKSSGKSCSIKNHYKTPA